MLKNKGQDKYMTMIALRQAKLLEDEIPDDIAPSDEFVERMNRRIKEYEKKRHRQSLRKKYLSGAAACLILVIIVGCGAKLTSQANRSSIAEFFSKYFSISHTDNSWDIAANEEIKNQYSDIYLPTWMPEGFKVSKSIQDAVSCMIDYSHENLFIRFTQREMSDSLNFDNEVSAYESFIKDGQKYYYCEKGKPVERTLIWEKDRHSFKLTSGISKEELVKVAESMVFKK